jgi:hypothetical protein
MVGKWFVWKIMHIDTRGGCHVGELVASQLSSSCTTRSKEAMIKTDKAIAASFFICCLVLAAQEKGVWGAISSNAKSITGDVELSNEKISIDLITFPMARIRSLEKTELSAAFDADSNSPGTGSLYRLNVPAARKFLRKNSLCGTDDTEWMATYVRGNSLQLAFFSGQKPPVFTLEALANSSDACGVFSYGK